MAKSQNIGLNLTEDENTKFADWRKSIDGNNDAKNKSNMQIIDEEIGNLKVKVTDIVDNLETEDSDKPLSANQGVRLKTMIDTLRNDILSALQGEY